MTKTSQFILLILIVSLSSCVTNKKLNYLQSQEGIKDTMVFTPAEASPYILKAGDELYIDIKPLYEQGARAFQSSTSTSGSTKMTLSSSYYYTYPVYEDGTIDYPYVGRIKVAGETMESVRELIKNELSEYVQGMTVIVKLASNYVNVLGEVKSPGRKQITTEKLNLFEAIALAGDLSSYGKRSEVKIIRETKDGPIIKAFDLRSEAIINSEYYWIQPGDIIYVSRIKGQFFKMDSFSDILTVFTSSLSLILLSISLQKL